MSADTASAPGSAGAGPGVEPGRLAGKRILLIGGSKGVGRAIGEHAAAEGARVAFAARSLDRVSEAAAAAGPHTLALQIDVCDEASVEKAVATTVEAFGGIDALVYAPAYGPLRRLRQADAELWRSVFDTNVIGATVVTRHVVDHLERSRGNAVFLSSVTESGPVWTGLSLYGTTKAALARLDDSWRHEHPDVAFTRLVLGPMDAGIESAFSSDWDAELAGELMPQWIAQGVMGMTQVPVRDASEYIVAILRSSSAPEWLVLQPRP